MLALITALLPLAADLTPLLMQLIAQVRQQPGMTDDIILSHARAAGDENTVAIVAERLRLLAEIDAQGGGQ